MLTRSFGLTAICSDAVHLSYDWYAFEQDPKVLFKCFVERIVDKDVEEIGAAKRDVLTHFVVFNAVIGFIKHSCMQDYIANTA